MNEWIVFGAFLTAYSIASFTTDYWTQLSTLEERYDGMSDDAQLRFVSRFKLYTVIRHSLCLCSLIASFFVDNVSWLVPLTILWVTFFISSTLGDLLAVNRFRQRQAEKPEDSE